MSEAGLLRAEHLKVEFPVRGQGIFGFGRDMLRAVDDVSLEIGDRETLGLVGESGSGKSTTGRALLGTVPVASGSVVFRGIEITSLSRRRRRGLRRNMQMVFQDPYSSLDPSMVVEDLIAEPLDAHEELSRRKRRARVLEALEQVGLAGHHLNRYPYEFSGGQRQRIAIARAIILRPSLVVCDEPVSALDVSTQSQIINLLMDLQDSLGLSYCFIAHDLALVRRISHRIAVMYLGKIVETGPAERLYTQPAHPYTAALLAAIPYPHPRIQAARRRATISAELPSPINPPAGCRFHTRCPWAMDVCRAEEPSMYPIDGGGYAACHLQDHGLKLAGLPLPAPAPDESLRPSAGAEPSPRSAPPRAIDPTTSWSMIKQ